MIQNPSAHNQQRRVSAGMDDKMMMSDYQSFIASKAIMPHASGLTGDIDIAGHLFGFQQAVTDFSLRQGRAGVFLGTGMGKSAIQLEWCHHAGRSTNGMSLILTPLAVARQFEREGLRWGYDCRVIRSMDDVSDGINICNYDRLDRLDPDAFGAVSLDEGSAIKAFGGKTTMAIMRAFSSHRFRLSATATPAPNDHMELGTQAEFLGVMNYPEMLSKFFINDTASASQKWRLKGHAVIAFWDWMASWSRMATMPSDLGFPDDGYLLPPLIVHRHKAAVSGVHAKDGELFATAASATSVFDLKRQTTGARSDVVANLVNGNQEQWLIWCDTNDESKALKSRIPDAVEVTGSMTADQKEDAIDAFVTGDARNIISKPSIMGLGVNLQRCANVAFVGRSFSFESYYQAVRRCWRFGQTRPVNVHIVVAEGEDDIGRIIDRKAADHERMQSAMADAMRRAMGRSAGRMVAYNPTHLAEIPEWLTSAA